MGKLICAFVLVLLAGSALQQLPTVNTCNVTDTNGKNYQTLQWLSKKGITINANPDTSATTICKGAFANGGSCCSIDSLQKYIITANGNVVGKWNSFVAKIAKVRGKFMNGLKVIRNKMNAADVVNKIGFILKNPKIALKFAAAQALAPQTAEDIAQIKSWIDDFETNLATFKTQGKECFNLLKTFRANLFCTACQFNAGNYVQSQTSTDVKFNINADDCKTIVQTCWPVWKFNFQMISLMQYVNLLRAKGKGDAADNKFASQFSATTTVINDIKDTYRRCNQTATKDITCNTMGTSLTNTDHINRFCTTMITINKHNGYLEGDDSFDEGMNDSTDVDGVTGEADANATPAAVRRLQSVTPDPNPSSSDPNIGAAVVSSGGAPSLLASDTGLIPGASVDTSTAGNTSSSLIIKFGYGFVLALFFLLK